MQLQVLGNPKPTVSWYLEDQPLHETEFLKITAKGEWHKVSIDEILIDDEGIYKCVAENDLGVVETETEVLVEGKIYCILSIDITTVGHTNLIVWALARTSSWQCEFLFSEQDRLNRTPIEFCKKIQNVFLRF